MTFETTSDPKIVFTKFRRTARFINDARRVYERADLDEHLKVMRAKKCDHFLRGVGCVWLIELKGGHFEDAIPQIISTANIMKEEIGQRKIVPVVVAQDCPAVSIKVKHLRQLKAAIPFLGDPVIRSGVAYIPLP